MGLLGAKSIVNKLGWAAVRPHQLRWGLIDRPPGLPAPLLPPSSGLSPPRLGHVLPPQPGHALLAWSPPGRRASSGGRDPSTLGQGQSQDLRTAGRVLPLMSHWDAEGQTSR